MAFSTPQSPRKSLRALLVAGLALPLMAQGSTAIKTDNSSIKFGLLLQPQFETLGSPTLDGDSKNFFLRRTRFLVGGTIGTDWEYFFETDSANLGKAGADGTKNGSAAPTMIVQDAVITYKAADEFKLDIGLILIPFAHNSLQSAASLLSWDYYSYSFLQNGGMTTDVGRDLGVQARGMIAKHLEYRLGMFQGKRSGQIASTATTTGLVNSRNSMRIAGRLQYNVLDTEPGMFYAGTYGGARKILSFGVGYDAQDDYKATAFDVFVDMPLGNKDVVTFQANQVQFDGGSKNPQWIALAKTSGTSVEAGYRFTKLKFSPILRFEKRTFDVNTATNLNETRTGAGVAFWLKGHNTNIKVFYMQIKPENVVVSGALTKQHSYNSMNVQLQYFIF